jgi:hypothetical protein
MGAPGNAPVWYGPPSNDVLHASQWNTQAQKHHESMCEYFTCTHVNRTNMPFCHVKMLRNRKMIVVFQTNVLDTPTHLSTRTEW